MDTRTSCRRRLYLEEDDANEPLFGDNTDSDPDYEPGVSTKKKDLQCLRQRLSAFKQQISNSPSKSAKRRKAKHIRRIHEIIAEVQVGSPVKWEKVPNPLSEHSSSSLRSDGDEVTTVNPSNQKLIAKKRTRKENYCLICTKFVKEFCKHYESVHKDTTEGKQLRQLNEIENRTEKLRLKRQITDLLRKKGNAYYSRLKAKHNYAQEGGADVIPVRRSAANQAANQSNCVQCVHCEGFYARRKFHSHLQRCAQFINLDNGVGWKGWQESDKEVGKVKISGVVSKTPALNKHSQPILNTIEGASDELFHDVLKNMPSTFAKEVSLRDVIIMRYASSFHKTRRGGFQVAYVRRVICDLARLLTRMRETLGNELSMEDLFNPSLFSKMITCVLEEGGYDPLTGEVAVCGLGNRLQSHIKKAAEHAMSYRSIAEHDLSNTNSANENRTVRRRIKHFLNVMNNQWANEAGRIFDMAAKKSKSERSKKLAAEEDIVKTCQHINTTYQQVICQLDAEPDNLEKQKYYNHLLDMLVTHIMCLIRRRPVDFKRAVNAHYALLDTQDDMLEEIKRNEHMKLSNDDLKQCERFKIFYVPGKGFKEMVPITLTKLMKEALDALQRNKKHVAITSDTLFIRAQNKAINPTESLKKVTKKLKLKKPLDMSGNGLRHHAATFSKLHSEHPQYQDYLASALGHSLHVHRLHYELPSSILQKLIVMPVLEKMTRPRQEREPQPSPSQYEQQPSTSQYEQQPSTSQYEPQRSTSQHKTQPSASQYNPLPSTSENYSQQWIVPPNELQLQNQARSDDSDSSHSSVSFETPKKITQRLRWSDKEKEIIFKSFGKDIIDKRAPPRSKVVELYYSNPDIFSQRTKESLATYVNNLCLRKQLNVTPEVKKFTNRLCNVPI